MNEEISSNSNTNNVQVQVEVEVVQENKLTPLASLQVNPVQQEMIQITTENMEFEILTLIEKVQSLNSRIEICEKQQLYSTHHKNNLDWFTFENRIRNIIKQVIEPTAQRVKEARDLIDDLNREQICQESVQQEIQLDLSAMHSDMTDSFRFKVIEELNTKYIHIKMEIEKREQVLLNSILTFDDKLLLLHTRINHQTDQILCFENKLKELDEQLRKDFKVADEELLGQFSNYTIRAKQIEQIFGEMMQFKEFIQIRVDAFSESIKLCSQQLMSQQHSIINLDEKISKTDNQVCLIENDALFAMSKGHLKDILNEVTSIQSFNQTSLQQFQSQVKKMYEVQEKVFDQIEDFDVTIQDIYQKFQDLKTKYKKKKTGEEETLVQSQLLKLQNSRTSIGRRNSFRDLGLLVKREINKFKAPIEEQLLLSNPMPGVTEESSVDLSDTKKKDQFVENEFPEEFKNISTNDVAMTKREWRKSRRQQTNFSSTNILKQFQLKSPDILQSAVTQMPFQLYSPDQVRKESLKQQVIKPSSSKRILVNKRQSNYNQLLRMNFGERTRQGSGKQAVIQPRMSNSNTNVLGSIKRGITQNLTSNKSSDESFEESCDSEIKDMIKEQMKEFQQQTDQNLKSLEDSFATKISEIQKQIELGLQQEHSTLTELVNRVTKLQSTQSKMDELLQDLSKQFGQEKKRRTSQEIIVNQENKAIKQILEKLQCENTLCPKNQQREFERKESDSYATQILPTVVETGGKSFIDLVNNQVYKLHGKKYNFKGKLTSPVIPQESGESSNTPLIVPQLKGRNLKFNTINNSFAGFTQHETLNTTRGGVISPLLCDVSQKKEEFSPRTTLTSQREDRHGSKGLTPANQRTDCEASQLNQHSVENLGQDQLRISISGRRLNLDAKTSALNLKWYNK